MFPEKFVFPDDIYWRVSILSIYFRLFSLTVLIHSFRQAFFETASLTLVSMSFVYYTCSCSSL